MSRVELPEISSVNGVELAIPSLSEEAVLGLDRDQVLVRHVARLRVDLLRQTDVEVADGLLLHLVLGLPRLPGEADPADGLVVGVLDSDVEGKTILSEGVELVVQLVSTLGDGEQVSIELKIVSLPLQNLHISRLGDLVEVFLVLQSLVLLVVSHAEHPHPRLQQLMSLGEHTEPGESSLNHVQQVTVTYFAMKGT